MATSLKQGQQITLTTSETEYVLDGPIDEQVVLTLTWISGVYSFSTGSAGGAAVIADTGYASHTGNQLCTVDPGSNNLRMKTFSAGVVAVSW